MTRRRALISVFVLLIATSCEHAPVALDPAGPQAGAIADLTNTVFVVCSAIYALTMAAAVWALARRRRPEDDSPPTSQRLGRVVTGAVGVSIVILVVIAFSAVLTSRQLTPPNAPSAVAVDVIGHQWWWQFTFKDPAGSGQVEVPNELHVPVGEPVALATTSRDVIHSFWVPRLQGKRDLVPGITTHTWLQADQPGTYNGQCAEFCGHQHAHMRLLVVAETREAFESWLAGQGRSAAEPATEPARRGRAVFMSGPCVMCHTIRGTDAGARFGPDLTHVGSRRLLAGVLPMTSGNLARWVANPQAIKPGVRMPPTPLAPDDLQALAAYLESLK